MVIAKTVTKTIRLHPMQAEFRHSKALYRAFIAGRGGGKSWVGAYDLLCRAERGRTYLVGSPTGVLMGDTTFPTFKALAEEIGVWNPATVRLSPYPTVVLHTGATIRFRTAENPETMRGPNLSGAWLDEASLMDEDAYRIMLASLRENGRQGWMTITATPKGTTHWTYEAFGKDPPRSNTELFHCRTRDNPFLPEGFEATLAEQYVGQFARQELGGEFVNMEGADWPAEYFPTSGLNSIWFGEWPDLIPGMKVMSLDPSKGKEANTSRLPSAPRPEHKPKRFRGDFSAFVSLGMGLDRRLYIDCDMARRPTPKIVQDGITIYQRFEPSAFAVEINAFQELLGADFKRVAAVRGLPNIALYGITNSVNKQVRIRMLGPLLAQGKLRFKAGSLGAALLVQQLRDFPVAEHDDGPDALEMAVRMLTWLLKPRRGAGQPVLMVV